MLAKERQSRGNDIRIVLWLGSGWSLFLKSSHVQSLILSVTALREAGTMSDGAEWRVIG